MTKTEEFFVVVGVAASISLIAVTIFLAVHGLRCAIG